MNWRRFLTRAGEDSQRWQGALDRLCAWRLTLHPSAHPRLDFLDAMRESLAWQCLSHPAWARFHYDQGCLPRLLRQAADLDWLPAGGPHPMPCPRQARRWQRLADGMLLDLGWSLPHRQKALQGSTLPECLGWLDGRHLLARCECQSWHWPRTARWRRGRLYSASLLDSGCLWLEVPAEALVDCSCGRGVGLGDVERVHQLFTNIFSASP